VRYSILNNVYSGHASFIELLITKQCNLACGHCMYSCDMNQPSGYMSEEVLAGVKRQVDMLEQLGIYSEINIIGGEPTLNLNEFERVFNTVSSWGTKVQISTNGWWLNSDKNTKRFLDIVSPRIPKNGLRKDFVVRISSDMFHVERKESLAWKDSLQRLSELRQTDNPADLYSSQYWMFIQPNFTNNIIFANGRGREQSNLPKDISFCLWPLDPRIHYNPWGNIEDVCGNGSIYDFGTVDDNMLFIVKLIYEYREWRSKKFKKGRLFTCYDCRESVQEWKDLFLESKREEFAELNTFDNLEMFHIDLFYTDFSPGKHRI